jgi:lipopolysaccharide biosynthesis glycosyltransferase
MRDTREQVNLLMCANAAYLQHVAVCLCSLLANNPELFFNIVVVGHEGEIFEEAKLARSLAFPGQYVLSFRYFAPPLGVVLPLGSVAHYSLDNWTRIWVADFFPSDVTKVLYLDSDIVVVGEMRPLWETALDGALLGAVASQARRSNSKSSEFHRKMDTLIRASC